ncbi:MAG: 1,4-alpha-glucan branching protein [Phycisphaerae bacterium SM23_30]|nr:MAG: 1,4-alpha-glucan branching protein [Phycisphaerae bacterium SM23_30]
MNNKSTLSKGQGAFLDAEGASFRVWAPHADEVLVTGDFNNWSETAHPLSREENGYWSVHLSGVKAGQRYKYRIINGSQELFRIDPYAREVTCSTCHAMICGQDFFWDQQDFHMPAFDNMVIYEMHIGTFNHKEGDKPGSFYSALEKLDYLQDLGVNAVEVMPAMEFKGSFSWGYNPALIYAIETDYGGPKAFKEFVKAAHAHGIAVILDVVYNHFGPGDLDLWQFDGWSENNKGGIYFYNDWRSQTPWGDTRPDYGRGEVRQYIHDNALMWLEEYHLDGLRWDATAFIRNVYGNNDDPQNDIAEGWTLMQWINQQVRARQPGKISIAEDIRNNSFITKPATAGGAGFDSQWDGFFVRRIRGAIAAPEDQAVNMDLLREAIEHRFDSNAFLRVIYTESHDEVANGKARVPEEVSPGNADAWIAKKLSTLGAALVFTAAGIPMIFQGQELLEDQWFHDKDPIDWARKDRFAGIIQLYKDLIRLRLNRNGYTLGLCGSHTHVYHINNQDKILAFHRYQEQKPGDSVIVVVNMKHQESRAYQIGMPRPGLWKVRFNSDASCYDESFSNCNSTDMIATPEAKDGLPASGKIDLGPYSILILSQDPSST